MCIRDRVRTLFEQEKVKYFVLNGKDLSLQVREEGDKVRTLHYQLPDLSVFYSDLHELIDRQHESGVLEGYDYKVGFEGSWWYRMLPYLEMCIRDRTKLVLEEPIKACGGYQIRAKLGYEVTGTVKVMVTEEK